MKKVIFVGGTAYSGSTFFDMTLGNDPTGFSTGEIHAYFNPTLPHHVDPLCGCGEASCALWPALRRVPQEEVYAAIFDRFPEVEFIVDSSKDPLWIYRQSKALYRQGIETRHILIWKTPLEIAHSFQKRGLLDYWQKSWVNYHRKYLTLVETWGAVQYRHYVEEPQSLAQICAYLDIPYFSGKDHYWEKTHHLLFGNDSARVHLDDEGRALQDRAGYGSQVKTRIHQKVYYRPVKDAALVEQVTTAVNQSRHIRDILTVLEAHDVARYAALPKGEAISAPTPSSVRMSPVVIWLRTVRKKARYAIGRMRYGALA